MNAPAKVLPMNRLSSLLCRDFKTLQMATKRNHVTLTLSEKLKVIDLRRSGCSLAKISAKYGIE